MKKKKIDWQAGSSGFHYKEWKEAFYPRGLAANKWFQYYSTHFNTVETNVSFYRLPLLTTLEKWYKESPDDFSFSVKASRLITHYKRFKDTASALEVFYTLIRKGLKEKVACILFQFPPDYAYTPERLNNIISGIDPSFNNVTEFRHISWYNKEVYRQLAKHSITFCNMSHPKFPDEMITTAPFFYIRFHGVPVLYKSAYSEEYLDDIIKKIKRRAGIKTVYLYFNNTWGTGALENMNYIKSRL
ncbi:MAG TPA: DUF72 domain-containing protein [Ferruginibacter sp.]|nr:DUF72 domain-containing protein [Ferruginibacter sp.]